MLRRHSASALPPGHPRPTRPPPAHRPRSASEPPAARHSPDPRHTAPLTGAADIEALTRHLQRADTRVTELELHLPAHTDAKALARLLSVVDQRFLQGQLTALSVTAEGSDQGPIDEAVREVLANSKACLVLSGKTVRHLILGQGLSLFQDSNLMERRCAPYKPELCQALADFVNMEVCREQGDTLEVQAAGRLAQIAVDSGEDALLHAVRVLSPHYQWRFTDLPDPRVHARLERAGVPCCLTLSIDHAAALSLADWLGVVHPLLQAIELSLNESLAADTSMLLWNRLAGQPSMRRVELDIPIGVTIDWLPRTEPALVPTVRLNLLRIRLHDPCKQTPPFVAQFMEWFQPVNLELRSLRVSPATSFLKDSDPACQRPLRSLSVVCDHALGPRERGPVLALIQFLLRWGDQVQYVCVHMKHALPGDHVLKALETVAEQALQLRSLELTGVNGPQGEKHRFEKPLRVALRRGRFFDAYLVGAVEGFFQHHLLGTADPADRVDEAQWVSADDALSLDRVSSQTHHAAVRRRREEQARVLVNTMVEQRLDPPTLRELLMGPSGELDIDLVTAVFQRLCDAQGGAAVWDLFDEATAFPLH